MSLSYEPHVKITNTTAREICDDIWAGSIKFAEEAGYSTTPLVTTALWCGLLLSVKKDLDKHDIFDDVQKQFVPAFSKIYNIGLDQVEILADIKSRMQKFWEIISAEMGNLEQDLEIVVFLKLVDDINEQNTNDYKLTFEQTSQLFKKHQTLVSSHIYNVLHVVDNDMLLQYSRPGTSYLSPVENAKKENKKESIKNFLWTILVIALIIAVLVFLMVQTDKNYASKDTESQKSVSSTTTQAQQNPAVPKPANGRLLDGNWSNESEITVHANTNEDCVVLLKTVEGKTKTAFFVRAGESATIGVPAEKLYVFFAYGNEWYGYGKGKMFGENTSYSKDDELIDFSSGAWEYTLYPVTNGNFSDTPIGEEDFF